MRRSCNCQVLCTRRSCWGIIHMRRTRRIVCVPPCDIFFMRTFWRSACVPCSIFLPFFLFSKKIFFQKNFFKEIFFTCIGVHCC
ncbi:hypothetical protein GDO81_004323 [Engystomops pustulosus]|uniref:Uncharacterized protein n=1 Tax=Engystomops pustulosus TaxID=76066 RepID=A0AAV6ZWD8_ENGPU|nr:hypothetical protein GDO81_004323 [Engystomops pustulosus]